eukprot:TRINITY_DN38321_c0_g2_i1.p1 TRINITY_DN38321_c0_g2~~TRINITY_DN38321_c0_g2_i1.p1  ORF type:complete len:123 (-),score=11.80 TRINITY_DN38321_c0_g2_i1:475-843(-)
MRQASALWAEERRELSGAGSPTMGNTICCCLLRLSFLGMAERSSNRQGTVRMELRGAADIGRAMLSGLSSTNHLASAGIFQHRLREDRCWQHELLCALAATVPKLRPHDVASVERAVHSMRE